MVKGITRRLSEYVTALRFEDIPAEAVDRTGRFVLDAVGIAFRASVDSDSTGSIRDGFVALARDGKASVFGTELSLSPAHAAAINASLCHSLDFDDTHREGSVHPGASVVPTVLALAEEHGADGPQVITAIVAGYDVTCKLAMALDPQSHYDRGFHPTGTAGVFGATAAGASLLGLSAEELENAFGVNCSQAAGSMQFFDNGAWNKRIHPGLAAHNAILALEFAKRGFVGSSRAIEGDHGVLHAYSDTARAEVAVSGLGERFEILHTAIKPYPACRYAHAPLDAIIDLVEEHGLVPDDVESVVIGLPEAGVGLIGRPVERKRAPKNIVDGQFSMHFLAAVALTSRRMTWDEYDLIGDPGVDNLMQRTEVVPDDEASRAYPEQWLSSVEINTRGKRFAERRTGARGEPELFLEWDEIERKFDDLAEKVLTADQRLGVKEASRGLSRGEGPRLLCESLRRPLRHEVDQEFVSTAAITGV
ncbi:MAG: MmgE/PrpD family protein [Actinobacteria bacterium]|nr:MmgE/PrpD family protein [Actinomycetota bacterium]